MKKKKYNKVSSSLKAAVTEIGWQEALDVYRDAGREMTVHSRLTGWCFLRKS
jgi:hypothetical protein